MKILTEKEAKKKYEADIIDGLLWLGIKHDNKPYRQSEKINNYAKYLKELIENGKAYEAEKSKEGPGKVVRFKNPNKKVAFSDLIRGEVEFNTTELGDFVIAKNINEPLYHLAVVVDDKEAGVTHIIRGEDHISNTPRQILILEALGFDRPKYAHIPLTLAKDGSKLSKRHGAVSVNEYKEKGYLPGAFVNFLALLGWHPEGEQEIFSLDELIDIFDLSRMQKGGAIFEEEKLDWINKQHLAKLSDGDFKEGIEGFLPDKFKTPALGKLLPLLREKVSKYSDVKNENLDYFYERPDYKTKKLNWKEVDNEETHEHLQFVYESIGNIQEHSFNRMSIKEAVWEYASEKGRGNVLWPLRYALSGQEKSPDPFVLADILGKEETLARIEIALDKIA